MNSPVILTVYINDLISLLQQMCQNVFFTADISDILCLRIANDVACGVEIVHYLQLELHGMSVNLSKTETMVSLK